MAASEQALIEKIKQLPPQRLAEVEDFVDFLRARDDERGLTLRGFRRVGTTRMRLRQDVTHGAVSRAMWCWYRFRSPTSRA